MSPAIAPPPIYRTPTASASVPMAVMAAYLDLADVDADLVEEPMDYTPIAPGRLAAPDLEHEVWIDDDSGPMGF
jgi:hypothetical protein